MILLQPKMSLPFFTLLQAMSIEPISKMKIEQATKRDSSSIKVVVELFWEIVPCL